MIDDDFSDIDLGNHLDIRFNHLSDQATIVGRTVTANGNTADLPAKTIPRHRVEDEQVMDVSTGFSEYYVRINEDDLNAALSGEAKPIEGAVRESGDPRANDMRSLIVEIVDKTVLTETEADYIISKMERFSDFISQPLLPELDKQIQDEHERLRNGPKLAVASNNDCFNRFLSNSATFFRCCEAREMSIPLMAAVPKIDSTLLTTLLEIYAEAGVEAYCVNFNRSTITSKAQAERVRTLLKWTLKNHSQDSYPLLYAVNLVPVRNRKRDPQGIHLPGDFAALGMGFGVLGDCMIPARGGSNDSVLDFRIFERENLHWRAIPIEEVPENFPEHSGLDQDVVARRIQNRKDLYRIKALLGSEQMAFTAYVMRSDLSRGQAYERIADGTTITNIQIQEALTKARRGFEAGIEQSELEEFG